MRIARRSCLFLAVVISALAGCSSDIAAPPEGTPPSFAVQPGNADLGAAIRGQIDVLFRGLPRRTQAQQFFNQIEAAWRRGQVVQARSKTDILFRTTLEQLEAGILRDPDGSGPQTPASGVAMLFNMLLAYTGQPFGDISPDASVTLVVPSNQDQTIDSDLDLLVQVPGGALSQSALLVIERDETGAVIAPDFAVGSKLYDVRFVPAVTFTELTVGICVYPSTPPDARLAHGLSSGVIDILPPSDVVLPCTGDHSAAARPSAGGPLGALFALGRRAASLFTPTIAYAGHAALAGTVFELSPFQVIETATNIDVAVGSATYGGTVDIAATLTAGSEGKLLPGRSLTLEVNGVAIGAASTDGASVAGWSVPATAAGTNSYRIEFGGELTATGDTIFRASVAEGSYTVDPAPLTLTASSAQIVAPATIPPCVVTYDGLVNGDTPASLGPVSTCTYPAVPGVSSIVPSAITPANYVVTYVPGTFSYVAAQLVGTFESPITTRVNTQGSTLPVRFSLTTAAGDPVPDRQIDLRAVDASGLLRQLGPLVYQASTATYDRNVSLVGWPIGPVTFIARLDDGTEWQIQRTISGPN